MKPEDVDPRRPRPSRRGPRHSVWVLAWAALAAAPLPGQEPPAGMKVVCGLEITVPSLVALQREDGSWSEPTAGSDVRVSALAVLALLADGSTLRQGPWRAAVRRGSLWLCAVADDHNRFGFAARPDWLADHLLATLALAEALRISHGYRDRLLPVLRQALEVIVDDRSHARAPWSPEWALWCAASALAVRGIVADLPPADPGAAALERVAGRLTELAAAPPAGGTLPREAAADALRTRLLPGALAPLPALDAALADDPLAAAYAMAAAARADAATAQQYREALRNRLLAGAGSSRLGPAVAATELLATTIAYRYCRLVLGEP